MHRRDGPGGEDGDAVGIREGLLALLADGPRHGYLLKLEFEEATGGVWPLNVGQVYDALQRLESAGMVTLDGEDEDGRKRYRLTDDGRDRLRGWLVDQPVPHQLRDRDELTIKVLLAARLGGGDTVLEVIAAQRASTMGVLQTTTQAKARAGPEAPLEELVHLDRLILQGRAELDWLDLVEERLAARAAGGDGVPVGTGVGNEGNGHGARAARGGRHR
jgi:DNA-binding PadR family transcriptional regulator